MVALTHQSSAADNTAKTSYTFTSLGIGSEDFAKRAFVAIDWRDNDNPRGTLSSATIGGVPATISHQHSLMASNLTGAALIWADVPTGSTASVSVTFSAQVSRCQVAVLTTTDPISDAVYDFTQDDDDNEPSSVLDLDLDFAEGGCAILVGAGVQTGGAPSWSITGMTEVHEAANGANQVVVAVANDTSAETAHNVVATFSGSNVFETVAITVSFAPRAKTRAYTSFFG